MPGKITTSSPGLARYGRPVIIALLLVAVIAGVRAAGPGVADRGPWRQDAPAIGIGLEVALAGLQAVLAIRARRRPEAGHLAGTLRTVLRYLTALAMVVIVVIVAVNLAGARGGSDLLRVLTGHAKPRARRTARPITRPIRPLASVDGRYILYGAIALIVLAALVSCVVVVRRMRAAASGGHPEAVGDDRSELSKAVESGRTALRALDDARAAIIACYLAMEGSLAGAGAARTAAETPDELLSRAVASGLLRGPAAAALTALFYEARFSSHPLADTAKHDARQALDAISAELRGSRVAVRPHGSPAAGQPTPPAGQPTPPAGQPTPPAGQPSRPVTR